MKELSIEEKAKAYDEAIERAKAYQGLRSEMEIIFPELKESENERIRKNIKIALMSMEDNLADFYSTHRTSQKELLTWLEKQGETFTKKDVDDAYLKGISDAKKELEKQGEQKPADITDEWIEEYWQHEKVNNPYSYNKGDEIQFDYQGFVSFCKKYCQNPTWSEEDLDCITTAINNLEYLKNNYVYHPMGLEPAITFLKSLKDRVGCEVNCTTTKEWSEEDIVAIDCAVEVLSKDLPSLAASIERFKSLRSHNTWKPTEEQMKALSAINTTGDISYVGQGQELINLYNDLKKLK